MPPELLSLAATTLVPFLLKLVGAVALWIAGGWLIGLAMRLMRRALRTGPLDVTVVGYLVNILGAVLRVILVVAMLVTPGATAYLLTDRFDRMTLLAVASSVLSSLIGVYVSYWSDSSTAGCIVLAQTALFLLAFLLAPRYGILNAHRSQAP